MTSVKENKIRFLAGLLGLACFLTGNAFCALPKLDLSAPQKIRVVRVINPRLPSITDEEFSQILEQAKTVFKKTKGVDLVFIDSGTVNIRDFFFKYGGEDPDKVETFMQPRNRMIQAFSNDRSQTYEYMFENVAPLVDPATRSRLKTREDIIRLAVSSHFDKLSQIKGLRLPDGAPLLERGPYGEFTYWGKINLKQADYDLIITNQILASMETEDVSVSASMRGGVNTGMTSPSPGPYGGAALLSTFPILTEHSYFTRDHGRNYDRGTGILIAGTYLTHELAHLILHEGHPVKHPGCVLNTARGLRYLDWYEDAVNRPACKKKHPVLTRF